MKGKAIIFIIGLLVGAIVATGAFYIYSLANPCTCTSQENQGNNQMPNSNGQQPPEPPSGQNNQPLEKPSGEEQIPSNNNSQSN